MADSPIYVIYHDPCMDGFSAAWAACQKFGNAATYIPARYGQPFPKDKIPPDSKVYLLDSSYKRAEMEDVATVQKLGGILGDY